MVYAGECIDVCAGEFVDGVCRRVYRWCMQESV